MLLNKFTKIFIHLTSIIKLLEDTLDEKDAQNDRGVVIRGLGKGF